MGAKGSITLWEAVGRYVATLKPDDHPEHVQRELFRFVQWSGSDRTFSDLSPPEIGEYADKLGGTGNSPLAAARLQMVRGFLSYARKKGLIDKNLAMHVRIYKSKTASSKARARSGSDPIELTPDGHAQLMADLQKLRASRAPLAKEIQSAAADKDVRENVPLEAAREQLGHVESRIRSIEYTLKAATIMDPSRRGPLKSVTLGARVLVRDLASGRETSYMLVSPSEANPLDGKISNASPLGKALMRRSVGLDVEVVTPRGNTRYRILKVSS